MIHRQFKKYFFISLFSLLCNAFSQAQSIFPSMDEMNRVNNQGNVSVSLHVENDSLLLNKDDGFFTSGIHLNMSRSLKINEELVSYGMRFGQELYTASDINLKPAQLSEIDHPYAGWIYMGAWKENINQNGSSHLFGFDIGCLGPCAGGEATQKNLHRLLNQALPQAWSSQLKQELGLVARMEWSPKTISLSRNADISQRYKTRIGNIFADASAEMVMRYGNLPTTFKVSSQYAFAKADVRAVAYNATIQGGYFNQQILAVSPRRFVPEIEIGYLYRQQLWGVSASVVRRGSEIKELSNAKGAQNFIRLNFHYSMN